MSPFLLGIEAIAARFTPYSCPRGTAGRIHALRLRRRFQPACRPHSLASGTLEDWNDSSDEPKRDASDLHRGREQQQLLPLQLPQVQNNEDHPQDISFSSKAGTSLQRVLGDTTSSTVVCKPHSISRETSCYKNRWQRPSHLAKASHGDMVGVRPLESRYQVDHHDLIDSLHQALRTESPHAIINALTRFTIASQGEVRSHDAFQVLPPNVFTEILRCLDPEHFVGRYVDLQKQAISTRSNSFTALRLCTENGLHKFCASFMARIELIIEARRSSGFDLSLSDYKHLLRCAVRVEDHRASQKIWRAMKSDGLELDTECYNLHLSGILKVGISNGTQWSELRTSYLPRIGLQEFSTVVRGYYDTLGIDFKYETSKIFNEMLQQGIAGDEKTFCLLMISSARVGDVDSVKAILGRVWGINVDNVMTTNENSLKGPKSFPMDSPFRPSLTLLFAISHCFGINDMVPVALRLIDYVSRRYSLTVPIEVWEDLLGMTHALSSRLWARTGDARNEILTGPHLQADAVSNLWAVLTTDPFNIKPSMAMYDRLIISLLRRQRFGEAQERIEEAQKLHVKKVYEYGKIVAVKDFQSTFFEGLDDSEELGLLQGSTASEIFSELQRDETFNNLAMKRSRQYLHRWCRILIKLGSRSLLKNPNFMLKNLPRFIYEYRLFMPRRIEYPIATGYLSFSSDSGRLSQTIALGKAARPWPP